MGDDDTGSMEELKVYFGVGNGGGGGLMLESLR